MCRINERTKRIHLSICNFAISSCVNSYVYFLNLHLQSKKFLTRYGSVHTLQRYTSSASEAVSHQLTYSNSLIDIIGRRVPLIAALHPPE